MKKMTKMLSVFLCAAVAITSLPLYAFAQPDAPCNLYCVSQSPGDNILYWDSVYDCGNYNVYISTDGVNFSVADTCGSNEYYVPYNLGKGTYYYYVTAVGYNDYGYWDGDDGYTPSYPEYEESAPSNTVSVNVYESITPYAYLDYGSYNSKSVTLCWSAYGDDVSRIDGFTVYQSVNGGDYTPAVQVPVSSYMSVDTYGDYEYRYSFTPSAEPAKYNFVVSSYAVLNGVTYCSPDFSRCADYTVYMSAPTLTTKTKSEKIKWQKVSGADSYAIYGGTYSNMKRLAVVPGNKTSYTVKNVNNYKKDYVYYVACIKNGVEFSRTEYMSSADGTARMRAASVSKKKKSTVKVINTRQSKNSTAWTVTITKKDKKILDNFAKKHFKKGWTNIQKAQYTLEWINANVKYASGGSYNKIAHCSYVEAVFSKKCGQCLQYNGAYAMFLTYLGYEARIIQGWRGSNMKNKWSHYWCEIKVDGKWYLMETGNLSDSGSWMYFCQPYRNAGGYLLNKKVAK